MSERIESDVIADQTLSTAFTAGNGHNLNSVLIGGIN